MSPEKTPKEHVRTEKSTYLEIRERLGQLGIGNYTELPRKTKKTARKAAKGQRLTQYELSRLEAARRRSGKEN